MSNSVVPAAAVAHAKQLVRNKKLPKRTQDQKPTQDEQLPAEKDHDAANAVQTQQSEHVQTTMSDTTLSADFSFMGALTASAEASASLAIAQDDGGSVGDDGDGAGGTVLLVGAVGLVGLGVAVLAGGGGGDSNEPPAFSADSVSVTTKEDVPATGTVSASDPDGDPLSFSVSTAPTKGTATVGNDGKFTYTPSLDFSGKDSFVVTVNDGQGGTDTITVNVTVDPVNDGPRADKANTSAVTTNEDTPVEIVISFTDPEGNTPLVGPVVTDAPDNGTFALVGGKNVYTPNKDFNGKDSITYTVTDSLGAVTTQKVDITVNPVNDAPTVAETQTVNTQAATAVAVTVAATDVDGDTLTFTAKGDADPSGTITGGAGGKFTYTPNAGFTGTDTFVVTVDDGKGGTDTQTVTVNVGPTVKTTTIDIVGPNSTTPATVQAGDGIYNFTDDATKNTDVRIVGFGNNGADPDDKITVTGATVDQYNFGTGGLDGKDLTITFINTTAGTSNLILIEDVLNGTDLVFDYDSAVDAIGFNFMTFA